MGTGAGGVTLGVLWGGVTGETLDGGVTGGVATLGVTAAGGVGTGLVAGGAVEGVTGGGLLESGGVDVTDELVAADDEESPGAPKPASGLVCPHAPESSPRATNQLRRVFDEASRVPLFGTSSRKHLGMVGSFIGNTSSPHTSSTNPGVALPR